MTKLATMVAVAALAVLGSTAHAQIMSIPPLLQGEKSFHLWSIPGVVNSGGIGTVVTCTNANTSAVLIGIQVFDSSGAAVNDPSATSLNVAAGATALFATTGLVGFIVDSNLEVGPVLKGAARVLATGKGRIICSAFLADWPSSPPTSMTSLTIVKGTTQKGQ